VTPDRLLDEPVSLVGINSPGVGRQVDAAQASRSD
jgi:hypothetical protein